MLGYITDPGADGGLERRELDEPTPGGPNQVVVEVRAFAVNRGELMLLTQRPDGWHPGQDVGGVVVARAADGSGPPLGTRVVALADQGGWSERVCVPSHRVAALPDAVSFAQAAALPVSGLTALRALRQGGDLLGRAVLVTGASGGVGQFAVQLAKAAGATVTGLVSGPDKAAAAAEAGADEVITSLDGAGPFHLALDGVGAGVLVGALRALGPGGTVVAYGAAGGRQPTELGFWDFAGKPGASLVGMFVYQTGEATFGEDLGLLARMVADGRLRPPPGGARDWAEAPAAIGELRRRRATGKVVLTVEPAKGRGLEPEGG
jgi:NADPH:quinone reductase-like Zn-dependent oxidoreductase